MCPAGRKQKRFNEFIMAARILPNTNIDGAGASANTNIDGAGVSSRFDRLEELLASQTQVIETLQSEVRQLRTAVQHGSSIGSPPAAGPVLQQQATLPAPLKAGKTKGDAFLSAALKRAFPMYVLPIKTLLSPSFQMFRPHEELKAAGALVEWQQGMAPVVFVSHTWLRHRHPDSEALDKFKTLTQTLKRMLAGSISIKPGWMVELQYRKDAKQYRIGAKQLQSDLADGFVFFDYMSIPQAAEAADAQQRAIASLVSYVSDSRYFWVVAGGWTHENGGSRDEIAWGDRGWCSE